MLRPAAACTCGPAKAARSSSRAIPSTRSTRASSAPGARPRSRASTIPAGSRRRWPGPPTAASREITWDDAIARLAAKLGEAGNRVAVISGGVPRHLLRSAGRVDRGAGRAAGALRELRSRAGARRQPPGVRPRPGPGARLRQGEVHHLLRRRLPGELGLADRAPARVRPGRTDSPTAMWPSSSTPPRAGTSPASTPTSGCRSSPAPRRRSRWRWPTCSCASGATIGPASRPRSARSRPAMAAQETGLTAETIERLAREFAAARPSLAVAGGIGSQHAGLDRGLRRGERAQLRGRQHRRDGAVRRRPADGRRARGAGAALSQAMDGGEVAVALVHDANPAYTLPKSSGFAARFAKVGFKVSTSLVPRRDRGALRSPASPAPRARALGRQPAPRRRPRADAAGDGAGLQHPGRRRDPAAGEPQGGGRRWPGSPRRPGTSTSRPAGATWPASWAKAIRRRSGTRRVQRGGVYRDPPAPAQVALALADGRLAYTKPTFEGDGGFTFLTYPHPMLHDGRGANKPWLMENADPVTKITWHSWVEVSPAAATTTRRARRRDRGADLALRQGGGAGLRLSRHP